MPGVLPTTSAHLSDQASADMIDQFSGVVESQFTKTSMMRNFVTVKPMSGTDTHIERRVGRGVLQALIPGVRPDATPSTFGSVSVVVDTVVLARANRSLLNQVQADFGVTGELTKDQGKECGKFFDQALLIQAMKGAAMAAPAGLNGAFGAGKLQTLTAVNQELDPDLLYAAISRIIVAMQEEDIDTEECGIFVRPTHYDILLNHNKLVDKDFSEGNSDFSLGRIKSLKGSPIISTARIPNAAIVGHRLSNAANANAYDVSAIEAKAVAVVLHPRSLIAAETIPLTSDIYFSKEEKQWFIDSWMSFGCGPKRPDVCGVVRRF